MATAALAAAAVLRRLAELVAEEPAAEVPRPPHLADAPEHWLRMVAANAPGLLRPPTDLGAEPPPVTLPPSSTQRPRVDTQPRWTPPGRADAPVAPSASRAVPGAERRAPAPAAPSAAGAEPSIGVVGDHPTAATIAAAPATLRTRRTGLPRVRAAGSPRVLPADASAPGSAPHTVAVHPREAARIAPAPPSRPRLAPLADAPARDSRERALYPDLPPRAQVHTPVTTPSATSPGGEALSVRVRPVTQTWRGHELAAPAARHWPDLPPAPAVGTARLQRKLDDWRAELVRIQEVG